MTVRSTIRITAYVVSGIWSFAIAVAGLQLPSLTSKLLSFAPIALVVMFSAWDYWLWHIWPFILLPGRPYIAGTWFGEFDSQWVDKGELANTRGDVALIVKQTYTQLSLTLCAQRSKSYSLLATVRHLESGEYTINYQYANTPSLAYRETLASHAGSTELTILTTVATELTGEYWTNRFSRGSMTLGLVSRKRVKDLSAARELSSTQAPAAREETE